MLAESYTFTKIALLPNGFHKRTRNSTFTQNTTVFDAPFHVVFCMLADDENLKESKLGSIMNGNIKIFITSYFKKGIIHETLMARTRVLELFFNIEMIDDMRTINCESADIQSMIEFYVGQIFTTARLLTKCKCGSQSQKNISYIEMNDSYWNLIENGQNVEFSIDSFCPKCKENVQSTFDLKDFLIFTTNRCLIWETLPKNAIFQGGHYKLHAIIEKVNSYFIAHVRRPNEKWYTFDQTEKSVKLSDFQKSMDVHCLCYSKNSLYDEFTYQHVLANCHTLTYNGENIRIMHGCAPNSILHSLGCLYIDFPKIFEEKSSNLMNFLIAFGRHRHQTTISSSDSRYEARYKILEPHFEKKKSTDDMYIDCYTNIHGILDLIVQNDLASLTAWCTCSPTVKRYFSVIDIEYDMFTIMGFNSLEQCISFPRRLCESCGKKLTNMELGNIIFLDVQPIEIPNEGIEVVHKKVTVHDIPQSIQLKGISYTLKGVIEHKNSNHYIANCLRSNNKWYKIDDIPRSITEISSEHFVPNILIFTKDF